jgi:hypothetical protein
MDIDICLNNKIIYLIETEGEKSFREKYSTIVEDKTNLDVFIYIHRVIFC